MKILEDLSSSELSKFAFDIKSIEFNYLTNTNSTESCNIYELSEESYNKIIKRFNGLEEGEIEEKDKVFIIPGVKLPKYKIKEILKEKKANITNNIEIATKIIGTKELKEFDYHDNDNITFNNLFIRDIRVIQCYHHSNVFDVFPELNSCEIHEKKEFFDKNQKYIKYHTYESYNYNGLSFYDSIYPEYSVFPQTLKILYKILSDKIPVINESYFHSEFSKSKDLADKETFNTIYEMLDSNDRTIKELGIEMLCDCKLGKNSTYNLWKIATKFSEINHYSRTNNLRFFLNNSNFRSFSSYSTLDIIEYLQNEKELTKEILESNKEYIIDYYKNHLPHSVLCNLKVEFKEEYQNILDDKVIIEEEVEDVQESLEHSDNEY
jgi:hypothetical protein